MRYEKNKRIKDRRIFRMKKAIAVGIAFFMVFAFAAVDRNCGNMVGNEDRIIPAIVCEKPGVVGIKWGRGKVPLAR